MKLSEAKQILNKNGYLLEDRFGGGKDRYGHKINRIKLSDVNFDDVPDEDVVEETPSPKTKKVFSDVQVNNLSIWAFEDNYKDNRQFLCNQLKGKPVSKKTIEKILNGLNWDKWHDTHTTYFGIYDYIEDQGKCYIGKIGKDGNIDKPNLLITWYANKA